MSSIHYDSNITFGRSLRALLGRYRLKNKVLSINRQVQWMVDDERDNLDKVQNNGSAECGNGYWYFAEPE